MKATDLIKSISISDINSSDMKVVTAWNRQTKDQFLNDNFGTDVYLYDNPIPLILDSQDYLCLAPDITLNSPDGISVLKPDMKICELKQPGSIIGNVIAQLYKMN